MNNYGYNVSPVEKINDLSVEDSDVLLAQKYDISVYFITSDSRKRIIEIFDDFDINDYSKCHSGGGSGIGGNYKYSECDSPNYMKSACRINNTMIYTESKLESKQEIEDFLKGIEYID